jgi:hypothetical protein
MNPLFRAEYVMLVTLMLMAVGGLLVWRTTAKFSSRLTIL